MRYLKRTTLNNKTVTGNRDLYIDQSGEVVINLPYSLTLPRGSNEDQSPDDSTLPSYVNGIQTLKNLKAIKLVHGAVLDLKNLVKFYFKMPALVML